MYKFLNYDDFNRGQNSALLEQIFEDAIFWACKGNFSMDQVDSATVAVFQQVRP